MNDNMGNMGNSNNMGFGQQRYNFNLSNFKGFYKIAGITIIAVILLTVISNMFFFSVDEREQVVIKQFNEVVKIVVDENVDKIREIASENPQLRDIKIDNRKGLHFKVPFLQTVESFTSMLLTYDTEVREVITKDKKKLVLDNFAVWKITNPALFSISLRNERAAHTRLDDIIYSKLNEEIGKVEAHVVISDKNFVEEMLDRVIQSTNKQVESYGMEVVDVKIKKTDLPVANYSNIFNRMKTERERSAKTYRSEGQEEAQKIRSEADKEATIIEAKAYEEAEKTKGEGDAEALRIYAEAYNKDPEFYAFWRSLQAYKKTLKDNTKIIIDSNSEFAKYLYNIK
ncbi:MAG TPA: protease modulator HflC [Clostridiales bacterium]|nr:protease modulator HflC [Clostridiales bacterium]